MSSRRIFDLTHKIHSVLAATEDELSQPFAGKQVILVGEFLQLRPVANLHDDGQFMFESQIFQRAFRHRFKLTESMRLESGQEKFAECLKDLSMGICGQATSDFMCNLSRELAPELKDEAVHIFFRKTSVQLWNHNSLKGLPGEMDTFASIDSGDITRLKCPVEHQLSLKEGCRVMLVWNKSDKLKNGSAGIYQGNNGDCLIYQSSR